MSKPPIVIDRTDCRCPLFKKPCSKIKKCAWYIEKQREYPDGTIVQIKCCSIYLDADEHENSNNRLAKLQKEMGETKQAAIFQAMALLGGGGVKSTAALNELRKLVNKNFPPDPGEHRPRSLPDADQH